MLMRRPQLSRTNLEKTKVVIFLLIAIVSTIVSPTMSSLASAQQPAAQGDRCLESRWFSGKSASRLESEALGRDSAIL